VGDIILVRKDQVIPADILLLDSFLYRDKECICYVDSYLVDGNKDLSKKQASSLTKVPSHFSKMKGKLNKYK
jgi:magnesium-transporting ATPase (P-type)